MSTKGITGTRHSSWAYRHIFSNLQVDTPSLFLRKGNEETMQGKVLLLAWSYTAAWKESVMWT